MPETKSDDFANSSPAVFSFDKLGAVAYTEFGKKIDNAVFFKRIIFAG
jgi:hypothetical protein